MYLSFFPATLLQSLNQVNTKFMEVRQEQLPQPLIVLAKKPTFHWFLIVKANRTEMRYVVARPRVEMAEVIGQLLKFVGSEVAVIPEQVVASWTSRSLEANIEIAGFVT